MFSGIIQGTGLIDKHHISSNCTFITTSLDLSDCKIGSSISCNGVCLTVIEIHKNDKEYLFGVNIGEETRNRSNLSEDLKQKINIEKSLKIGDEISGHFLYGHIDCVTNVSKIQKLDLSWVFEFKKLKNYKDMEKFIVEKGSIAINGISLTVANVTSESFSISIIPYTYDNTNLNETKENDFVNIEFDALARYIHKND